MHSREGANRDAFGPVDDGRSKDRGGETGAAYQLFGLPLGAVVRRGSRLGASAHGAHVDESPHAGGRRCVEHPRRSLYVYGGERGGAGLHDDAHEVNRGVGLVEQRRERGAVGEVARNDLRAPRREGARSGARPREQPDGVPAGEQEIDDVSADEAGGSRHGDSHGRYSVPPPPPPSSRKTSVLRRATTVCSASNTLGSSTVPASSAMRSTVCSGDSLS